MSYAFKVLQIAAESTVIRSAISLTTIKDRIRRKNLEFTIIFDIASQLFEPTAVGNLRDDLVQRFEDLRLEFCSKGLDHFLVLLVLL